jgi:alkaline phosphatase D
MDRRDFLRAGAGTFGLAALGGLAVACTPGTGGTPSSVWSAGVASGLHSPSEVVLWTRVEPLLAPTVTSVDWQVASDPSFVDVVASGTAPVTTATDNCVKVLVGGLSADRSYWYRFRTGTEISPVGRARTLPEPGASASRLALGVASCQSYASGFYGAWRDIAAHDLDAVLFVGDYIYESFAIQLQRRVRDEMVETAETLDTYRQKYRLYRSDPDIQAGHAAHPLVPVWDDHEVGNDWDRTWRTLYPQRVADAFRVWFEYMPVWPIEGDRIYRSLRWGDLGEIFLLDTRQYRDTNPAGGLLGPLGFNLMTPELAAPGRTILGTTQREWLVDGLAAAQSDGVGWKLIGNQVMIAPIRLTDLDTPELRALDPSIPKHAGLYLFSDSWDGFSWERDVVLGHLHDAAISDVAFLTGDVHSFWAAPLRTDYDDPSSPLVAYEYTCGSVTSPAGLVEMGISGGGPTIPTEPAFDYIELRYNGWGMVECTPDEMNVTYRQLDPTLAVNVAQPKVRFTAKPGIVEPSITLL